MPAKIKNQPAPDEPEAETPAPAPAPAPNSKREAEIAWRVAVGLTRQQAEAVVDSLL